MDCHHCITEYAERKKGQHLRMEDRGAIKVLKKLGLGTRAIARQIGCAPSTVTNELRRGTPARKSNKGKAPGYSPKLGEAVYRANRASCHRHPKAGVCSNFTSWVVRQIREHKWSLDACCGYAIGDAQTAAVQRIRNPCSHFRPLSRLSMRLAGSISRPP